MVTVSVVIPCFNQGQFVDEAVCSVLAQSFQDFEIIVVNDGSTDPRTIELLGSYSRSKTRVITTDNQGLAAARNNGIAEAKGKYILPLDADDRIEQDYMAKAVALLEEHPEVGIAYCKARLFGVVETEWVMPEYSLEKMLVDNVIFCSAFFRKEDWLEVGGYDPGMVYGWEDYEFWLSLLERGRSVIRIPETLFCYRVASDSMVRSKEKWQKVEMFKRIYRRHQKLFSDNIAVWIDALLDSRDVYYTSRMYVDCGEGISDATSVARKIEPGTRKIVFDLRDYDNIIALRFDPADTWTIVAIDKVTATYDSGQTVEVTDLDSNALYVEDGTLFFDTRDSQCYFPGFAGGNLHGLAELSVNLHFKALGEKALELLVNYQKDELRKLSETGLTGRIKKVSTTLLQPITSSKRKS